MSDLSVFFHKVEAFFSAIVAAAPQDAQGPLNTAASAFSAAGDAATAAIPAIAKAVVDAIETKYGASGYIPLTNAIFDEIASQLLARKTA